MLCGGIDLGGTKIEARLFDGEHARTVDTRRIPTPKASFAEMMAGLLEQVAWLDAKARNLPIGVAIPGVIDPHTGESFASNIPTSGHSVAAALALDLGREIPVVNDCMAFAFSEAHGGAGAAHHSVMGLILGTGVGGGLCYGSTLAHRHAGLAVEIGHVGISARALARHGLPLWECGCGRTACMENYISGTGLAHLANWKLGETLTARELVSHPRSEDVLSIWADLTADCLDTIQLLLDPDCIVLGGGVSNISGVAERLSRSLHSLRLGSVRLPQIVVAQHGDSSGARGAALVANKVSEP